MSVGGKFYVTTPSREKDMSNELIAKLNRKYLDAKKEVVNAEHNFKSAQGAVYAAKETEIQALDALVRATAGLA